MSSFKAHTKFNFIANGVGLKDEHRLFNNAHRASGKTRLAMAQPLREILVISGAVLVVVGATYTLTRSWLIVALVFGSGLGLGAVWLIVRAVHAVIRR